MATRASEIARGDWGKGVEDVDERRPCSVQARQHHSKLCSKLGRRTVTRSIWAAALLIALQPTSLASQVRGPDAVTLSVDGSLHPVVQSLGATVEMRLRAGLSLAAAVGWMNADPVCIETSPSPCSPEGVGFGMGFRLKSASERSWWPYVDALGGGHRYAGQSKTRLFLEIGAGVGWYVGSRGSMRLGVGYTRINADSRALPDDWPGPDPESSHNVIGITLGVGVRIH